LWRGVVGEPLDRAHGELGVGDGLLVEHHPARTGRSDEAAELVDDLRRRTDDGPVGDEPGERATIERLAVGPVVTVGDLWKMGVITVAKRLGERGVLARRGGSVRATTRL
jgi:hypothetical protein